MAGIFSWWLRDPPGGAGTSEGSSQHRRSCGTGHHCPRPRSGCASDLGPRSWMWGVEVGLDGLCFSNHILQGHRGVPAAALPLSVLCFVLVSSENRKPWATVSSLRSPPQTVVRAFAFYYRPWRTCGLFVVEPLVRNANSSPPVSPGKASFTARTSLYKPSLCGWAPAPGLDEGLGGTSRGSNTTVPYAGQTTQTTCSKGTVLPELGLWSTSGPPNARSCGQVSVGTLG